MAEGLDKIDGLVSSAHHEAAVLDVPLNELVARPTRGVLYIHFHGASMADLVREHHDAESRKGHPDRHNATRPVRHTLPATLPTKTRRTGILALTVEPNVRDWQSNIPHAVF